MQNVQGVELLKIKTEDLNLRSKLREFSSKIGSDRIDIGLNRIGSKISDRIGYVFKKKRIGSVTEFFFFQYQLFPIMDLTVFRSNSI